MGNPWIDRLSQKIEKLVEATNEVVETAKQVEKNTSEVPKTDILDCIAVDKAAMKELMSSFKHPGKGGEWPKLVYVYNRLVEREAYERMPPLEQEEFRRRRQEFRRKQHPDMRQRCREEFERARAEYPPYLFDESVYGIW